MTQPAAVTSARRVSPGLIYLSFVPARGRPAAVRIATTPPAQVLSPKYTALTTQLQPASAPPSPITSPAALSLAAMQKRRGPWSPHEDQQLLDLVHRYGAAQWVKIAEHIGSRSPKQCRERYHQNLKPTLDHSPITPEEGALIEKLVCEYGKRWAAIARELHGRSDNAVKNWWNGCQNRHRRLGMRQRHYRESDDSSDYTPSPTLARRPSPIDVARSNQMGCSSGSALSTPSLVSDSWSSASSRFSVSPVTPAVRLGNPASGSSSFGSNYSTDSTSASPAGARASWSSTPRYYERSYSWDSSTSSSAACNSAGPRTLLSPDSVSPLFSACKKQSFSDDDRALRATLPPLPSPALSTSGSYHYLRDPIIPCGPPAAENRPRTLPPVTTDSSAITLPPFRSLSPLNSLAAVAVEAPRPAAAFTLRHTESATSPGQDERMKMSRFV